ncbi:hypothetical protein J7F03_34740 [Streptomyces sp. ISL-43]|uniref:hypothetical protein n=1 Tax=Streptomyces sp. ISL-43 TaxID=2819183 RepID=UPI001BE60ADA|nr:hypothetical protein [Streptomyces sp. ISL-43]MBT2452128.1 hypothetical protein [Streptomyces sp. ISL-43]
MQPTWRLMHGPNLVGDLHQYAVDMPWFICRFVPGPDWPAVRELYEAFAQWQDRREADPEGIGLLEFLGPISDLGLELEASDGTRMPVFQRALVWIRGDIARVRC